MTREQFISAVRESQEPLRRFLLVLCKGDAFTADDIAQDACMKAWIALDGFKGQSQFGTWIFKIAYNSWLDRKYESKNGQVEETAAENKDSGEFTDDNFKYQELYQAIDGLSQNEKTAILLFYMEDKSIKDISEIMVIPQGTVKSLLSRGRASLRIKMK